MMMMMMIRRVQALAETLFGAMLS